MSEGWKSTVSRRPFLAALLGLFGLGAVGGLGYEWPKLFPRRYPPSPFDDLLAQLPDRDNAVRLGRACLPRGQFFDAQGIARDLRKAMSNGLSEAIAADLKDRRLLEVQGWILPAQFVALCALAASAAPNPGSTGSTQ